MIDYVWLENRAQEIRAFDMSPVSGLLQTQRYAEALMRAVDPDAAEDRVERWLELRMTRQQVLAREDPVRLSVVLDEAVLRRSVGGAAVIREQLHHLIKAARRPNIEIRILPFSVGAHASPDGGFRLLKMADPFPEVAYVEGPAGSLYIESTEAERLSALYDRLYEAALDPQESAAFMAAVAEEFQ